MNWVDIILYILLAIGVFFNLLGSLGLLRFPDVYIRLHAGTKCTTFGSIFIIGSMILIGLRHWYNYPSTSQGSTLVFHAAIALIAILLTNPTGAHAIARAAHKSGVKPVDAVIDELEGKTVKKTVKKKTASSKTSTKKEEEK